MVAQMAQYWAGQKDLPLADWRDLPLVVQTALMKVEQTVPWMVVQTARPKAGKKALLTVVQTAQPWVVQMAHQ